MSNSQARTEGDHSSVRESGKGAEHESAAMKMSHEALHALADHAPFVEKAGAAVNHEVQSMLHGFSINHGDQSGEGKPENKAEAKADAKHEDKADAKPDAKHEDKADAKPDAKHEDKADAKPDAKHEDKDAKDGAEDDSKDETKDASKHPHEPASGKHQDKSSSKHKQQPSEETPEQAEEDPLKKEKLAQDIPAPVNSGSLQDLQGQRSALEAMNLTSDGARAAMGIIDSMMQQLQGLGQDFAGAQDEAPSPDASTTDGSAPSDATEPPPSPQADATSPDQGQDSFVPDWMQRLAGYQNGDW
jgi:hypothetical protein